MADDPSTDESTATEEQPAEQSVDQLPEWARKQIGDLRAESARYRTENKALKPLASEAQRLRDAQKPVEEQAAERIAAAEKRAQDALTRAARSDLRALAAPDFANADDAYRFLDVATYVGADGEFDAKSAAADIKQLLTDRPYLAKAGERRAPVYQPGQGGSADAVRSPNDVMNATIRQAAGR